MKRIKNCFFVLILIVLFSLNIFLCKSLFFSKEDMTININDQESNKRIECISHQNKIFVPVEELENITKLDFNTSGNAINIYSQNCDEITEEVAEASVLRYYLNMWGVETVNEINFTVTDTGDTYEIYTSLMQEETEKNGFAVVEKKDGKVLEIR